MPFVHGDDSLGGFAALGFVAYRATEFGIEDRRQFRLGSPVQLNSMVGIVHRNSPLQGIFAGSHKNIRNVVCFGIVSEQVCCHSGKPPVNTLTAAATMPLCFGLEHRVRTRAGIGDQMGSLMCAESGNDLRLCLE